MDITIAPSPIQQIHDERPINKGVQLFIKRDELLHAEVQGNKWRKLKYNLQEAKKQGHSQLLTFGGAWSNHIYATAAAGNLFGFKTIGVIRGEEPKELSDTLRFALLKGMKLHYLNRDEYKRKYDESLIQALKDKYGDFYVVPEGGTNHYALQGVAEIIDELDLDFDYLCTAVGTGGTLAGLVAGLKGEKQILGFSSLKGEDGLTHEVDRMVLQYAGGVYSNFSINFQYHFGGYAKVKPELIDFIKNFKAKYNIQLEPVYTGKMMYGIFDLVSKGSFPSGTRIVALHTGGLQGLAGYRELMID